MRYLLLAVFPGLAIYLQTTVLQYCKVQAVVPDLVLLSVVFFALLNGGVRGGIYGICCGLLEDLYLGRMIGVNVLCKGVIGYLVGKINKQINPESLWVDPIGVAIGSILHALLFGFLVQVFDLYTVSWERMMEIFLIQFVYQVVVSIPCYLLYYHSHTKGWLKPAEEEERLWSRMTRLVK